MGAPGDDPTRKVGLESLPDPRLLERLARRGDKPGELSGWPKDPTRSPLTLKTTKRRLPHSVSMAADCDHVRRGPPALS